MLRCSVVGKWTGGAVGAEGGMLIGDCRAFGQLLSQVPIIPTIYRVSASGLPAGSSANRAMVAPTAIRVPSLGGYQLRDVALQLG